MITLIGRHVLQTGPLPCAQAFLVGDPQQLPATVVSQAALERSYNISLFQRLQAAGHPVQVPSSLHKYVTQPDRMTLSEIMALCAMRPVPVTQQK